MQTSIENGDLLDLKKAKLTPAPKLEFFNPVPVAVLLVPVYSEELNKTGILTVRRGIEPKKGQLALPGGYLEYEDWRVGALRELKEETGVEVNKVESVKVFDLDSVDAGRKLLIYGTTDPINIVELKNFIPNKETLELVVVFEPQDLAFPSHTQQLRKFLLTLNKENVYANGKK